MIPKEAISKADFDRQEKGLPLFKVKREPRSEPERPTVEDEITFEDLPTEELFDLSARSRTVKNKDGVRFVGYDVYAEGRDGKIAEGWMGGADFEKFRQKIRIETPHLLQNIGL